MTEGTQSAKHIHYEVKIHGRASGPITVVWPKPEGVAGVDSLHYEVTVYGPTCPVVIGAEGGGLLAGALGAAEPEPGLEDFDLEDEFGALDVVAPDDLPAPPEPPSLDDLIE